MRTNTRNSSTTSIHSRLLAVKPAYIPANMQFFAVLLALPLASALSLPPFFAGLLEGTSLSALDVLQSGLCPGPTCTLPAHAHAPEIHVALHEISTKYQHGVFESDMDAVTREEENVQQQIVQRAAELSKRQAAAPNNGTDAGTGVSITTTTSTSAASSAAPSSASLTDVSTTSSTSTSTSTSTTPSSSDSTSVTSTRTSVEVVASSTASSTADASSSSSSSAVFSTRTSTISAASGSITGSVRSTTYTSSEVVDTTDAQGRQTRTTVIVVVAEATDASEAASSSAAGTSAPQLQTMSRGGMNSVAYVAVLASVMLGAVALM
ncbi:hypothetical protein G7K_4502-t1 [Saitoella complicata NRRL Y-17804]|uniref:Uncharacterized protein n=2 Tax=Saitoella complicata (strain BCRC 22490 / CBS 7301 / JCM 7358 / NBRC 10748 / NRRL Y-17804) TaxID=698492 RepID=A0A0E9NLV4_SAICN|nr:hypothetical protein G7K_4502-t1 [Saitoella complicata NRRL Y-17804]